MLERVVAELGGLGVDEVVLSLGYQPDRVPDAVPRRSVRRSAHPLRRRARAARHRAAPSASPPGRPASTSTFLALNGDVLTDLDVAELWAPSPTPSGAAATIVAHPRRRPVPLRRGADRRRRPGRGVRREARPGTAPSNWINAGTYVLEPDGARSHPRRARRCRSSVRRSRSSSRDGCALRRAVRRLLDRRRHPRGVPPGPPRPARRRPRRARRSASTPPPDVDRRRDRDRGRRSGPDAVIAAGAVVIDSVVMDGRRTSGPAPASTARHRRRRRLGDRRRREAVGR